MKKQAIVLLIVLAAFILLVLFLTIGKYTGYFVFQIQNSVSQTSLINKATGMKDVKILVRLNTNVAAIKETLAKNCPISNYSAYPEADIFDFKEKENTFIIGSTEGKINAKISFSIPKTCSISGKYSIIKGSSLRTFLIKSKSR